MVRAGVTATEQSGGGKKLVFGFLGVFAMLIVVLMLFTTGDEPEQVAAPAAPSGGDNPTVSDTVAAPAPVATGGVSISLNIATATVRIDGEERPGDGPTRVVGGLAEGDHSLEVAADGYLTHQSNIQVVAGLAPSIPIKLDPVVVELAVSTVPEKVTLKLLGDGPAKPVRSPVKISRKPASVYSIEASAGGYLTKVASVEFDGSRTQRLVIALERDLAAQKEATKTARSTERGAKPTSKSESSSSSATKSAELIIGGMFPGQPPAKISVDGKSYGAKPRVAVKVSPGKHTVKWQWSDGKVATQTVKVGSGEKKKIRASR